MAVLRLHAEDEYKEELEALMAEDERPKPPNWRLSPQAVVKYLTGGKTQSGKEIAPKYIGNRKLMEICAATLASDRALLLVGVPGTAKTWVSEHLSAAVCGDSTLVAQGTAGMGEEGIRYSWNYAELLSKGPSEAALVPSPIMRAMQEGKIGRMEELTRVQSDVQDALISILSEKTLAIPELRSEAQAAKGFNVIATANDRDRGVNELSSALRRRFNTVVLPLSSSFDEEVRIVELRVAKTAKALELPAAPAPVAEIKRLVTVFRELRQGKTLDGKTKLKTPGGATLSPAEAISVMNNGLTMAAHFGDGELKAADWAPGLIGAAVKDKSQDEKPFAEYLETVVRERADWKDVYRACKELM